MMYWYGSGMSGWGYAFMAISLILFWGAVIAGIVTLVRYLSRNGRTSDQAPTRTPERLLAERFASGQIDEGEYRRGLAALQSTGQAQVPANGHARPAPSTK